MSKYRIQKGDGVVQNTLKALSDPSRRKILELLKDGDMVAGELLKHFEISGASLSHHLSILKKADLIVDKKQGTYIYYQLNTSVVEDVLVWMKGLLGDENEK